MLDQQRSLSEPPAHDELLFIEIHQVFELWFKQILFELEAIRETMFGDDVHAARHYLQRVHAIERVLIQQIEVLETMSPQDFLKFRTHLSPASGFQSVQFREIEFMSGSKDRGYIERLDLSGDEMARLEKRLTDPSLWDAFSALLETHGLLMPPTDEVAQRASLLRMAREAEHLDLFFLSESLLTYDELMALWRQRHVLMVERMIGSKTGTGGSTGAAYLKTTLDKRFFPPLWELRSYL